MVKEKLPPRKIPSNLIKRYTLGRKIKVKKWYLNDSYLSDNAIVYTKEQIDSYIQRVRKGEPYYYGRTDVWLYRALNKYPIAYNNVVIIGSVKPWYESICLAFHGRCTTLEYNKIICEDPRLNILTVEEFKKKPLRFDAGFSISSIEHDGLGRYGDPLNPDADLESMNKMKDILKRGAFLFLAVPVGIDVLVWNAHRIYGRVRLPMLFEGWKLVESFGFKESLLDKKWGKNHGPQPVFVLQNE
jgi:hypothetical protein